MKIPAYFSAAYAPSSERLLARLQTTADMLDRLGLVDIIAPPQAVAANKLHGLHSPEYLEGFLRGEEPHASRQGIRWSPEVRDAALWMLGGQLVAAGHALQSGIAMNIARGFHHAVPQAGSGYCPLNGLALVAHAMPDRKVFVLDCDEHGGNGTAEFSELLDNLYTASIFGTRFGFLSGVRAWGFEVRTRETGYDRYREALAEAEHLLRSVMPDLLIYQAGADCHEKDPKNRVGLTTRQMFDRDLTVFRMARRLHIPTLFVVAGGYQDSRQVARLNANTVRAARHAWSELPLLRNLRPGTQTIV